MSEKKDIEYYQREQAKRVHELMEVRRKAERPAMELYEKLLKTLSGRCEQLNRWWNKWPKDQP